MGAAAAASGGASLVTIGNSALFAGSGQLSFTPSSAATNGYKYTHSMWVSRSHLTNTHSSGYNDNIYSSSTVTGWPSQFYFDPNDYFGANNIQSTTYRGNKVTTAKYRDLNAWYHIFLVYDTTLGVASDRFQIYINGERVTDFSTSADPAINTYSSVGQGSVNQLYGLYYNSLRAFYGYISELYFVDGTALDVTDFGEYDSSGLFWTPKDPTVIAESISSYGNNGWYLNFSNGSALGEDFSGNNNDFSVTSLTQSTHTPTNIEALFNPINTTFTASAGASLSNGNRSFASASGYRIGVANLNFPKTGKWWVAVEYSASPAVDNTEFVGITRGAGTSYATDSYLTYQQNDYSYGYNNTTIRKGSASGTNVTTGLTALAVGDFMLIAFDADNQTVKWYLENSLLYTLDLSSAPDGYYGNDGGWSFAVSGYTSGTKPTLVNTANYDYTPPTGYEELNTTNIASATTRTASDTTKYFQTVLYEGSGAGQRVGAFQPFGNAFTVAKSALFDSTNSETLTRTPSGAGNRRTWTFSTWIKFAPTTGSFTIFNGYGSASDTGTLDILWSSNKIYLRGWSTNYVYSNMLFEDESQWGNLVMTLDTTQSTSSDRIKGYWNGVELTWGGSSYPSLNAQLGINQAVLHSIGAFNNASGFMGAYLAETVFVDGTALTPSSFGQTDTSTNRWIPKAVSGLSLGTNGFYLDYSNSSNLGEDQTGSNDFTNNNTVTQSTDSPTTNFAVINPIPTVSQTLSVGNTRATGAASSAWRSRRATISAPSGKFYAEWECQSNFTGAGGGTAIASVVDDNSSIYPGVDTNSVGVYSSTGGDVYVGLAGATDVDTGLNTAADDRILACFDVESGKAWAGFYDANTTTTYWYKNTGATGADPAAGTFPTYVFPTNTPLTFMTTTYNTQVIDFFAESSNFTLTPPTGFSALAQDNLASTDQFISAFSWIKNRDATDNYMLFDRVRGVTKDLHSNVTDAQVTNANTLQSFLAGGVQIGDDVEVNTANESYVLWNWMMQSTGSGTLNEDGSINSTVLVDTTLGLSVGTYTGNGTAGATIGHGLGAVPSMYICKKTSATGSWRTYHVGTDATAPEDKYLSLDATTAVADSPIWNDTAPTSSVFSLGSDTGVNGSGVSFMFMAFAPSQFISIGSYEGNGNANGSFAPLLNSLGIPIQPVWTLFKNIDNGTSGSAWSQEDTARSPINVMDKVLSPSATNAEGNWADMDFVTGGIKQRGTNLVVNESAKTIIYLSIGTPIIDTDGRIIAGR